MKKLIFLTSILLSLSTFAEGKLAVVDMMILVRQHPSYEKNKKLLTSTDRDYQKRLDGMKAELDSIQEQGKKLAEEYRNPMLSQTAKTKIETDMAAIQNRFLATQQKLRAEAMRNQQELSELEARMLKAQAEEIRETVKKFAEKEGYDFVLDSSAALYSPKSADVTDAVLKEMGVDPKKAKENKTNEGK